MTSLKHCCKCGVLVVHPELPQGVPERCNVCADGGCPRCGAGPEEDCIRSCQNAVAPPQINGGA